MGVPVGVVVVAAGVELDEAHAALDEAAGHEALAAELFGALIVQAVELLGLGRFACDVDGLGGVLLHAVGELVAFDARGEFWVVRVLGGVRSL